MSIKIWRWGPNVQELKASLGYLKRFSIFSKHPEDSH